MWGWAGCQNSLGFSFLIWKKCTNNPHLTGRLQKTKWNSGRECVVMRKGYRSAKPLFLASLGFTWSDDTRMACLGWHSGRVRGYGTSHPLLIYLPLWVTISTYQPIWSLSFRICRGSEAWLPRLGCGPGVLCGCTGQQQLWTRPAQGGGLRMARGEDFDLIWSPFLTNSLFLS